MTCKPLTFKGEKASKLEVFMGLKALNVLDFRALLPFGMYDTILSLSLIV